jgi:hypothetical protein
VNVTGAEIAQHTAALGGAARYLATQTARRGAQGAQELALRGYVLPRAASALAQAGTVAGGVQAGRAAVEEEARVRRLLEAAQRAGYRG